MRNMWAAKEVPTMAQSTATITLGAIFEEIERRMHKAEAEANRTAGTGRADDTRTLFVQGEYSAYQACHHLLREYILAKAR